LFTQALVRPPGVNFADGLTSAAGQPDLQRALEQHQQYCQVLRRCGLDLVCLPADERYPDGTFVEDTAVIVGDAAVITHPGAPSRRGETRTIAAALRERYLHLHEIEPPGTVDGGDVCQADNHFFIGVSNRTNEAGAAQLAACLGGHGHTSSVIDIRGCSSLLHLKSGIAYLGERRFVVVPEVPVTAELAGYELLPAPAGEEYAANCIRVNDVVLVAAGYPRFRSLLQQKGYETIAVDTSEFRKMDGGLSCLSLRF